MSDVTMPGWCDPAPWIAVWEQATRAEAQAALASARPGVREFAHLMSPAAEPLLEAMAQRAQVLTRAHFGRTVSLYAPLYLSNYCSGGCTYCGFAADRDQPRHRLNTEEQRHELTALRHGGLEDVLLLTGERCPQADFAYVRDAVAIAARHFHTVSVEAFAMETAEYEALAAAGCTGITLYQETYAPDTYDRLHRWGKKRDYTFRIQSPDRALAAGMRSIGLGALLGLANPVHDMICLFQHAEHLRRTYWKSGVSLSFPRVRHQLGDFSPSHPVGDRLLAQIIFAFRICFPDMPLVLSTREMPAFRDGMAGIGISRMSVASRTTVGGYSDDAEPTEGQFDVEDARAVGPFCEMLRGRGLEPVFKNWDSVFQALPHANVDMSGGVA